VFRQRLLLIAAASCAVALALEGAIALAVPGSSSLDAHALHAFVVLSFNNHVLLVASRVDGATPAVVVALTALLAVLALRAGRRVLAVAIPLATLGAIGSAELLKLLIDVPRISPALGFDQVATSSWPSGHATASMITLLCALLVAPRERRRLVAVGGSAAVLLVCCSLLVLGAHYPSDILGGLLLAGLWMSLTLLVVRRSERVEARLALREPVAGAVAGVVVALSGAAAVASIGLPVGGALLLATVTLGSVAAALSGGLIATLG
jgi:undecaprenyl-diphosphatase